MTLKQLVLLALILIALAACDTAIPAPPQITVVITAVDDRVALEDAVTQAIGGTHQYNIGLTETVFARGGITLTPSRTPTITLSPTVIPTRFVTPTPSPLPSATFTPTFVPLLTSTTAPPVDPSNGWVRVINNWIKAVPAGTSPTEALDVYVNDERIGLGIPFGSDTGYYQIRPGDAVRVTLNTPANTQPIPIGSTVINVPPGGITTVIAIDLGKGLVMLPISEDPSPLGQGTSRVTIVQANPALLPVNLLSEQRKLVLVNNLQPGQIIGPIDVPSGEFVVDVYDAARPDEAVLTLPPVELVSQVSYLVVMQPPQTAEDVLTSVRLVSNITRRVAGDVGVRFVNALSDVGPVSVLANGQTVIQSLELGSVSDLLPVAAAGNQLRVTVPNAEGALIGANLGPFAEQGDYLALLSKNPQALGDEQVVTYFSQKAPPSAINANIRLIHALQDVVPITLQICPISAAETQPTPAAGETAVSCWTNVSQTTFATASDYFSRNPEVYDVQVVLSGTDNRIAGIDNVPVLAGGTYDFIVLPGSEPGSAQLKLVQPATQLTSLFSGQGNPTAVFEAVSGTLTAEAPVVSTAVIQQTPPTPTPTRTPVATNTPRPTNTPEILEPLLIINPAPPNAVFGSINLFGQNFSPAQQYFVYLDTVNTDITNGRVNDDGTILASIQLPENLRPGPHFIRVCVDCRPRGALQERWALFIVADPRITPTPTPTP